MTSTSSKEKQIYGIEKNESSSSRDQSIEEGTKDEKRLRDVEESNKKIQDIVYLGFIIILITFIATIFGFIFFIIQNQIALSHVVDINSKYSNVLNTQQQIIKDLEQAVKENEKIGDDVNASKEIEKCIKYKGYFSIQCFNDNWIYIKTNFSIIEIKGITHVSPVIAFIIGYAGGDFLDGIYKILLKKVK